MRSMTGYGSNRFTSKEGHFLIEIHSINRKSLDINVLMPKSLLCLDLEVRKWLKTDAFKGRISIKITNLDQTSGTPSLQDLTKIKNNWQQLAKTLGIADAISLEFLASQARLVEDVSLNAADIEPELKKSFMQALQSWNKSRMSEGDIIKDDIKKRVSSIAPIVDEIEKIACLTPQIYKARLLKKLSESDAIEFADPERLAKELTIYADRVDTTEEIVRLKAHIIAANKLINDDQSQVGRAFDFLIQEIMRETNTIGVKCQNIEVSSKVLFIKSEIEKIREQVQNVE